MYILAFDTSNQACSVAVTTEHVVLGEFSVNIRKNHSLQLMPLIDHLLESLNLKIQDIDQIVVAGGPGSYTGLRIAASTAKSLAWALDIPLKSVSSLKVLAANISPNTEAYLAPVFDARRGNVYTGLYQWQGDQLVNIMKDTHISLEEWVNFLKDQDQPIIYIGDLKENLLSDDMKMVSNTYTLPRAGQLSFLSHNEPAVSVHSFEPSYLKLAEAEENWKKEFPDHEGADWVEKV